MAARFFTRNLCIKSAFLGFLVFQTAFSMLYNDVFDSENIYPVYNWNIFHTTPEKYWTRQFVYVKSIDGQVFDPPLEIFDIKDKFPDIDWYTFANKIHHMGELFERPERSGEFKNWIDENLLMHHKQVEWEFDEIHFELIDFHLHRKYIDKKVLGTYEAKVPETAP